ncbi:MAG: hypothetical protein K2P78_05260, partial [Gemmataceae bacterium]|nr:hypothetical protein [Gemmataceae bacterium]
MSLAAPPSTEPAATPPVPARTTWARRGRIAFALSPLVGVHLALVAVPFVEFSWLSVLLVFGVTRVTGFG